MNAAGGHIRYLPGPMAATMVNVGSAIIHNQNGKVKAIMLVESTATSARRIGEPTGNPFGVKFSVREKLEGGGVTWRHHPRCTYE